MLLWEVVALKHRWLAKSTIVRELLRRGWRRVNGGEAWGAFAIPHFEGGVDYGDPYNIFLTITWGESIHQAELRGRNLTHAWIHFQSCNVSLAKLAYFDSLMLEVARLRRLAYLDIDELGVGG